MKFYTIKKQKGKEYLCLEDRARIDGKVKRTFFKYLGPREEFPEIKIGKIMAGSDPLTAESFETKVYSYGISAALWTLAQEIDLPRIIDSILQERQTPNLSTGEYLTIAAINRIADPCSKTNLGSWFQHDWLSTRISLDSDILNAQTYWNVFQRLDPEQIEEIEVKLTNQVRDHFGFSLNHLVYDASNFYTYSQKDTAGGLRQTGNSKEKKFHLPIVNFFLVCAKPWGIPLLHEAYEGNTQDAKEFKLIPEKIKTNMLKLGYDPNQITLYFDKGNLSPKAFELLDKTQLYFLASLRPSMAKELLHVPRNQFTKIILPQTKKEVEYYRTSLILYKKERLVIVVIDPANEKKHIYNFQILLQKKLELIQSFIDNQLNVKMWTDEQRVTSKLKSLIGKAPWKEIILTNIEKEGPLLKVSIKLDEKAKQTYLETFGRSILFTNQLTWSAEEIIWTYREQYVVEHAFKAMKNPEIIAIRPIYVSSRKSIEGHIFICYLALFLLSILRFKLMKKGIRLSYQQIRDDLNHLHINKIFPKSNSPSFFKLEKVRPHSLKLVKFLHLDCIK